MSLGLRGRYSFGPIKETIDKVGIGIAAPITDFHIAGNIRIEAEAQGYSEGLSIATLSSQGYGMVSYHRLAVLGDAYTTATIRWAAGMYDDENYRIIEDNANTRLFIENTTGNVGIGLTTPQATLNTKGDVILGVATVAISSANITTKGINIWMDESAKNLTFKMIGSDGILRTGTLSLTS